MSKHHDPKTLCYNGFRRGHLLTLLGLIGLVGLEAWAPSPISISMKPGVLPEVDREAPLYCVRASADPGAMFHPRSVFRVSITVTGYSSTPDETDASPFITAMNTSVHPGIIALSRDLLREYTPGAPFRFGDIVELEGVGVFTVEDTMNPRYAKRG